jgi:CelD/BcsL family acetyltransferase involved in cellulose biosynthesis
MLPAPLAQELCSGLSGAQIQYEVAGFQTDLKTPREQGKAIIDSLSSNTRHQVRRSLRLYENAHGRAQVVPAQSTEEAITMFHEAGSWHRSRWLDSGYNNPAFIEFHETLIKRGFDHGNIKLFRIVFGNHVVGVFYFLLIEGCAYFYLQGLRSESNNKLKPGLNAHCLLMQHFLKQGYDVYDFMGGESQYKRQLCNQQNAFMTLRVHNGRWRFLLEQQARQLKHRLLDK